MVRFATPLLAASALLFSAATAQYRQQQQQQQQQGGRPSSWFIAAEAPDYNNKVVSELLDKVKTIRGPGEAYAAFDWDNTCMYGDISYTSVYYQMDNLIYRIPPTQFEKAFSLGYTDSNGDECLPQGVNTVLGKDTAGKNVTLKTALSETAKDYKVLYDLYIAPNETAKDYKVLYDLYIAPKFGLTNGTAASLDAVKETDAFKNFRAKLAFLTFGLEASYGTREHLQCAIKIGMTVFPQLLVGMKDEEMRSLIRSSIRWNLAEKLATPSYTSTGSLAKLATPSYTSTGSLAVKGDYMTGLRLFNGQETTMRALRASGVDVHIISASPQVFVEEVGMILGLTYAVPKQNVWAVRFTAEDGKFTGQLIKDYPITWGPGKAEIVEKWLKPKYKGKAPIYASGDSNGDCDFMNQVRDGVVHVNNRLKDNSNCIQEFYEKSCKYYNIPEPSTKNRYILQGQDKGMGTWIASGFTTKDGVKYTSGATANGNCAMYNFLQQ
ncbi:hypothetical protein P43SY_003764 [Pythium insidiosum]|uniref:Haloacid dehalogenase-like hydrolase n=1 Tax=Pythium insidiosum TaxID=114742 RepID=A0AAD5LAT8_PYTIN|nr:hypothetical protein P43SY_003764 [Pythium insidiosum]